MNKLNQAFDAHLEQVANGRKVDTPREHFEAGYFAMKKERDELQYAFKELFLFADNQIDDKEDVDAMTRAEMLIERYKL